MNLKLVIADIDEQLACLTAARSALQKLNYLQVPSMDEQPRTKTSRIGKRLGRPPGTTKVAMQQRRLANQQNVSTGNINETTSTISAAHQSTH